MKKILLSALFSISLLTNAFAGETASISNSLKDKFQSDFKSATNPNWTVNSDYNKVEFIMDGKKVAAYYQLNGELIGTNTAVSLDALPVRAKRTFAKKYADYFVKEAVKFESENEISFFVSAANDTENVILKVDEAGSFSVVKKSKS